MPDYSHTCIDPPRRGPRNQPRQARGGCWTLPPSHTNSAPMYASHSQLSSNIKLPSVLLVFITAPAQPCRLQQSASGPAMLTAGGRRMVNSLNSACGWRSPAARRDTRVVSAGDASSRNRRVTGGISHPGPGRVGGAVPVHLLCSGRRAPRRRYATGEPGDRNMCACVSICVYDCT